MTNKTRDDFERWMFEFDTQAFDDYGMAIGKDGKYPYVTERMYQAWKAGVESVSGVVAELQELDFEAMTATFKIPDEAFYGGKYMLIPLPPAPERNEDDQ